MTQPHNSKNHADATRPVSLPCEGGCTCGQVRYRLLATPLITHGCHCSLCQRQTGTAFAINALVEAENIEVLSGDIESLKVASPSGQGQTITRCATCRVAVWSCYHRHEMNERIRFLKVGTLDDPTPFPPDIHIFTSTKLPWLLLPKDVPAVAEFYRIGETWSHDSLARRAKVLKAGSNHLS